jgi:peptidoglycan/LPS O-acetylase OafA/YrhL
MIEWIYKLTDISNIKRISFRQDINGLRAIAVLAVVFYHAELELFKGGWLGVDIFFVISGYLISNIIISELNEGTFSFKNFYLRRIRRILPALFSTLLLTIPFAYFFLTPKAIEEYIDSLIASVFFFANYHFMNLDFYVAESAKLMPLLHTWSLAIEEQYYLLFPLLAFLVYKYFKKYFTFFIGFITLSSIYLNTLSQSYNKFYRLEFRIWELLLGVIVMILSSNLKIKHLEKIGIPLMFFPFFYFGDDWINDIEPKLIALVGIALIIFSNTDSSIFSKVLRFKLISIIGLSSYSIYLLHQPIFTFFRVYKSRSFENYIKGATGITLIESLILIGMTLIFGLLSFSYIERNLNKSKSYFKIIGFFIVISLSVLFLSKNIKYEYYESVAEYKNYIWHQDNSSCLNRNIQNICYVDNGESKNVYALGDSHLGSISIHLSNNSEKLRFNYYAYIDNACPPISKKISTRFCDDFNLVDLDKVISNIQNSIIIIGARWPLYVNLEGFNNGIFQEKLKNDDFITVDIKKELENTIKKLLVNNNKIIIIYPIPEQGWDVPKLFTFVQININDSISYPFSIWYERRNPSYEILDSIKSESIYRIYPEKIFCNSFIKNECVGSFEGKIFYSDDHHLSLDGGKLLTDQIIEVISTINLNN